MGAAASSASSSPPSNTSTNPIKFIRGTHHFAIANYSIEKEIGVGMFIRSGIFEVGGYSWTIRCYPVGVNTENEGNISLYLELMSTNVTENITVKYSFQIHGREERYNRTLLTGTTNFSSQKQTFGSSAIINVESVELDYLVNDCLSIHCTVEVEKKSNCIDVPPSSICEDLSRLLESKHGADVTFQVGSNEYVAHRAVLATRSPVFAAQFFGPLAADIIPDNNAAVRIHDMEPDAFQAVLHFIYMDALPTDVGHGNSREKLYGWLEAADRYGLTRMRLLCENVLCESMDVENAAATLVLADKHQCHLLKSSCLDYIASPGLLRVVIATQGYKELKLNSPSLLVEILEKVGSGSC